MLNADVLLRDQFIENVLDPSLCRELKWLVREKPQSSLLDVRVAAICWEHEGKLNESRSRSYSVPSRCMMQYSRRPAVMTNQQNNPASSEVMELKTILLKQQEQINLFTQNLFALQALSRQPKYGPSKSVICRRCHRPGHYTRECENERVPYQSLTLLNPSQRPQAAVTSQVAGNLPPFNAPSCPAVEDFAGPPQNAPVSHDVASRLIGSCPKVTVQLGSVVVNCLLDTGSNVSTIQESFFKTHFQEKIQSCHWLQLKAANGLAIPYIGYVELDVVVLGRKIPSRGWLIVRDSPGQKSSVPGILGMNVVWQCYFELFSQYGPTFLNCPPVTNVSESWHQALQYCCQAAGVSCEVSEWHCSS
ncbi:hypothetical protein LDENG_00230610 [Lucifuga dentata]|nr:hypothetical protein LDENG_00230610 [Lucifuga dentata]